MGKHYTDVERINFVKAWRLSGLPVKTFADQNGLNRETFREWANAYRDLEGRFIKINVLTEEQVIKKSHHFSRFDHSVVVIEYKNLKVTTSLEQALVILEKLK
jgi:hypothetical protein